MDALHLRFTQAETSIAPPDLAAFAAVDPALLREQLADHDDSSPLADLISAGLMATRLPLLIDSEPGIATSPVFVTLRATPIPALDDEAAPEAPIDVAGFALADHVAGHLAWAPPPAARGSRPGVMLVLATCMSLALPDAALAQAPAARQPAATTSVQPPPSLPAEPAADFNPTPAPAPSVAPAIAAPMNDLDARLLAIQGYEAVVTAGGVRITGRVLTSDAQYVTMVDSERDGMIARIPRAQVTDVRGQIKKERRGASLAGMPDGGPQLAGGGVLVALGAPLTISGLVFVSIAPSYVPLYLPQLLPGLLMLGGGIPLLVVGSRRRRAYRSAVAEALMAGRLSPSVGRTVGGGWTGGLSFRF